LPEETAQIFLHIIQGLRCRVIGWSKGQGLDEEAQVSLQKEMKITTNLFINGIKNK
jgi:hypothetical protein